MKKIFITAVMAMVSIAASAEGMKPLGYPGSNWSSITTPAGVADSETHNTLLQGKFEQGIDWAKFGSKNEWTLNTYVSLGYSVDSQKLDYNNKVVPGVGVKMSRSFENGVLDLGVQAVHERRWINDKSGSGVQAYASYWFGWNLKK